MELDEILLKAYEMSDQEPPNPATEQGKGMLFDWLKRRVNVREIPFLVPELNGWLPSKDCSFFGMALFSPKSIIKQCETFPAMLSDRLLPIGSCPNGDLIALDLIALTGVLSRKAEVGFVEHDAIFTSANSKVRKCFLKAADSLPALLLSIADEILLHQDGRMDYWDIKDKGPYSKSIIMKYFS